VFKERGLDGRTIDQRLGHHSKRHCLIIRWSDLVSELDRRGKRHTRARVEQAGIVVHPSPVH
jgi:hypothetical protein